MAIDNMGAQSRFLNKDLFAYALKHGCDKFIRTALKVSAFDKIIFREETVISQILMVMSSGTRTNFLLNIFTLIDLSLWKPKHFR